MAREQAWRDTLPQHEREFVEHVSSMPPSMAIGYVYVQLKQELRAEFAESRKPAWRSVAQWVGVAGGSALAVLLGTGKVNP